MSTGDGDVYLVAQEILGYLAKQPEAADTVDGIRKWWLWRNYVERSREKVQKALDILVERGLVEQRHIKGGQVVYTHCGLKPEDGGKATSKQ